MSKNLSSRLGTSIAIILFSFSIIGCSQKDGVNNSKSSEGIGEAGRKVIYRDNAMLKATNLEVPGKIEMKVCIDRKGAIVFVELDEKETTINDSEVLANVLKAMYNYKYEADPNAPKEECGSYTVTLGN